MVNHCVIVGRLGRDPRVSKTGSGVSVANFPVAVDSSKRTPAENKEPTWFDVSAWDKLPDLRERFPLVVRAGSLVLQHSPNSPGRSRPPLNLWPSRTGLGLTTKT